MTTTDAARPEGTARRRTRSPDSTRRSRSRCTLAFAAAGSGSVGVTRRRECLLLRRVAPLRAWLLLRRCALRRAWDCSSAAAPRLPSCSGAAPLPHLLLYAAPLPHLSRTSQRARSLPADRSRSRRSRHNRRGGAAQGARHHDPAARVTRAGNSRSVAVLRLSSHSITYPVSSRRVASRRVSS